MREQTFTQIVTSNLGNIKMIHKIQLLLLQLLKLTHKHKIIMSGNKLIILLCGVVPTITNVCRTFKYFKQLAIKNLLKN